MSSSLQRDEDGVPVRMVAALTDVTERERAEAQRVALAHELHDSVLQDLAGVRTYSSTLIKSAAQKPELVAEVAEQVASAEENMRLIIRALRSDTTLLEARGSLSALTQTLTDELRRRDPKLRVEVSDTLGPDLEAGPSAAAAFGHVLREALLNVLHHSEADTVWVQVSESGGMLRLEVSDNGVGFNPGQRREEHVGVTGMRERAEAADGTLEVVSAAGQGTDIVMELPQPFLAPPSDAVLRGR